MTYHHRNFDLQFSEDDIVDGDNFIPDGEFNPHKVHPFILLDGGVVIAVTFADCLQDAIDIAVDADRLDRFLVTDEELKDYLAGTDDDGNPEYGGISFLGNASEPFDIESLNVVEVPSSKWTREYWTTEQLQSSVESAADSLGIYPKGRIGLTRAGFDRAIANLTDSLNEVFARGGTV